MACGYCGLKPSRAWLPGRTLSLPCQRGVARSPLFSLSGGSIQAVRARNVTPWPGGKEKGPSEEGLVVSQVFRRTFSPHQKRPPKAPFPWG